MDLQNYWMAFDGNDDEVEEIGVETSVCAIWRFSQTWLILHFISSDAYGFIKPQELQ